MSVTTTCRDVNELSNNARTACKLFFQECHKAGIYIFITETYRSQARQNYLYQQGRTRKGAIVTWTLNSRHKSRLAWDIGAATVNGNSNIYNSTIIKKAGAIAKKLNITWGGTWRTPDYPHFEVAANWRIPKGYSLTPNLVLPTRSNQKVGGIAGGSSSSTSSTVNPSTSSMSIVQYLNSIGIDSSFSNRTKLAKQHGVPSYRGTAEQNNLLRDKIIASRNKPNNDKKPTQSVTKPVKNKEEKVMEKLKDLNNGTLRASFVAEVQKAVNDGVLTSSAWVDKARNGDITTLEMVALHMYIDRSKRMSSNTSPTMNNKFIEKVKRAYDNGILSDIKWVEGVESGSISIADAMLLESYITRELTDDEKEKAKKVVDSRKE